MNDDLISVSTDKAAKQPEGQTAKDSPEVLLQRENKQVIFSRFLVLLVLTIAAVASCILIFRVNRNHEVSSFRAAYVSTAKPIKDSFLSGLYLTIQTARGLSALVEYGIQNNNGSAVNLTLPIKIWQESTTASRVGLNVPMVGWSPLLRTDADRAVFEEFSQTQSFKIGPHPPTCFLCGEQNKTFTNPKDFYFSPGRGYSTCESAEIITRTGVLPPQVCPTFIALTVDSGVCKCKEGSPSYTNALTLPDYVYVVDEDEGNIPQKVDNAPYFPQWQSSVQAGPRWPGMFDQMSEPTRAEAVKEMIDYQIPTMSRMTNRTGRHYEENSAFAGELSTIIYYPAYNLQDEIAAAVSFDVLWSYFFTATFPPLTAFLAVVVENTCGQAFTFNVDTKLQILVLVGEGDLHNEKFDDDLIGTTFDDFNDVVPKASNRPYPRGYENRCAYRIRLYPEQSFEAKYVSQRPFRFSLFSACIFIFCSLIFLVYDMIVRRRQQKAMLAANRTSEIVMSLFPENVRERLYKQAEETRQASVLRGGKNGGTQDMPKGLLELGTQDNDSSPIADLFPSATVMFFDICSFTVWCSERNAHQCFRLLETLYSAFDIIAEQMGVFKVETIGDSYLAVCGLPTPREDHALVMAKFAERCLKRMKQVVRRLELTLGPSTGDLRARIGLHSGPVTAGVLRGAKGRFQLFGDTVNMTQRIESSGGPHEIHVSKTTANLLIRDGVEHWLTPREGDVILKGKGVVKTFWCKPKGASGSTSCGSSTDVDSHLDEVENIQRLVQWDSTILCQLLEGIVAYRDPDATKSFAAVKEAEQTILKQQANRYRQVPFHNFEHASHVLTSSAKLLQRIVRPDGAERAESSRATYELTYGISSDPMMLFAVCFAALIHDVDHTGLTNNELVKLGTAESQHYRQKSVAEQNSVDIAWRLLMEDRFANLRACIYTNVDEFHHFRHLIVCSVMATDIADKNLKALRESRWDAAFSSKSPNQKLGATEMNRKATIVFEYILQASDICHTMQHWQTYQKFNKRLFEERYLAWVNGHSPKHPAEGWYGGELWFFDNYIIPLAKKLEKCGVFGVTHHEFVMYAMENRREWEQKGKSIVEEMKLEVERKYESKTIDIEGDPGIIEC